MKMWLINLRFIELKLSNFLITALFLVIGLVSMNNMVSIIHDNLRTYSVISNLDKRKYAFFFQENRVSLEGVLNSIGNEHIDITDANSADELLSNTIGKLSGVSSVCGVKKIGAGCQEAEDQVLMLYQLENELDEAIEIPLKKGKWCYNYNDDQIEVVVSNESGLFDVGDILHINTEIGQFQLIVTGILESPALEFQMQSSGDEMCSLDFVVPFSKNENNKNTVLVYVASRWDKLKDTHTSPGRIIFFEDEINDTEMADNMKLLSSEGFTADSAKLKKGTINQIRICISQYLPITIILFVIVILGLVSSTILNSLEYRRHFAVFFVVGCSWKQCIIINFMYICSSVVTSLFLFLCYDFFISSYSTSVYNVIITFAICVFITLLSSVYPYINMKRMTPKELISIENET